MVIIISSYAYFQISDLRPDIAASDIDSYDDLMTVVVNAKNGTS